MRIAIGACEEEVATVLDAADELTIIEAIPKGKKSEVRMNVGRGNILPALLKSLQINVLICGAISQPLESAFLRAGIIVHSFVRGRVDEVMAAFKNGKLEENPFIMPGCHYRHRFRKCGYGKSLRRSRD
jgi:predicted Fe-Mo cluster-binding NifX family protein